MAEPVHGGYRDNPEVARERTDVDTKAIIRFAVGILATLVATFLLLGALFGYFSTREAREGRGAAQRQAPDQLPPEPRLEVSPRANLAELRGAEDKALGTYGWIDKEKNTVRIPIERAMEIIAQRGLPARKQEAAVSDQPSAISSASESDPKLKAERLPY